MLGPFNEKLFFSNKLQLKNIISKNSLCFADQKLKPHLAKQISSKTHCPIKFLKGGENLKTLESYEKHLDFLFKHRADRKTKIIAIGGGSLLDSISFLASTFLRGVDLELVPTTWLSCIDASVGAKTALNYKDKKNQIGSFYPPKSIYFVEELISKKSLKDAEGEILKTIILNYQSVWAKEYIKNRTMNFKVLKRFVSYKSKTVKSDPYEQKNKRVVLNLGHTFGHIVELKNKSSHGLSVLYGLKFALEWSLEKGCLDHKNYLKLIDLLPTLKIKDTKLTKDYVKKQLYSDKKRQGESVNFVFVDEKGPKPIKISIESFVNEYKRQVDAGL